jgi:hypothetical protein
MRSNTDRQRERNYQNNQRRPVRASAKDQCAHIHACTQHTHTQLSPHLQALQRRQNHRNHQRRALRASAKDQCALRRGGRRCSQQRRTSQSRGRSCTLTSHARCPSPWVPWWTHGPWYVCMCMCVCVFMYVLSRTYVAWYAYIYACVCILSVCLYH